MAVAFFDLDRTLLECNSGRLWMQSEWRAGRMDWGNVLWGSYWLLKYHLGYGGGLEEAYRQAVASLAGLDESLLSERTTRWFDREVAHRARPGARRVLEMHRERGDRLVLATSASVYEAKCAAEKWGLEPGISTSFEVENGCFTGSVGAWAFGDHKCLRAEQWAKQEGASLDDAYFYTDSKTDLKLLERVGHPVVVHPDRKLERIAEDRGWPVEYWDTEP